MKEETENKKEKRVFNSAHEIVVDYSERASIQVKPVF
jgi:hypothetical protein